jgi:hypothetical protein
MVAFFFFLSVTLYAVDKILKWKKHSDSEITVYSYINISETDLNAHRTCPLGHSTWQKHPKKCHAGELLTHKMHTHSSLTGLLTNETDTQFNNKPL